MLRSGAGDVRTHVALEIATNDRSATNFRRGNIREKKLIAKRSARERRKHALYIDSGRR